MILKSTSRRIYKVMSERRQIRTSAEPFHSCQGPSIRSWHLFTSPSVLAELDVTAWRDLLAVARGWVRRWHHEPSLSSTEVVGTIYQCHWRRKAKRGKAKRGRQSKKGKAKRGRSVARGNPCTANAYAPTNKKSALASDSADNMSLKSWLNNVRFLECPSGNCKRPYHQNSFCGRCGRNASVSPLLIEC